MKTKDLKEHKKSTR